MFFQSILHALPGLFVLKSLCFSILALALCAEHQMSKTKLAELICLFPQEDRACPGVRTSMCRKGKQCRLLHWDCPFPFSLTFFFVCDINVLTQFIVNNMNSIHVFTNIDTHPEGATGYICKVKFSQISTPQRKCASNSKYSLLW